MLFYGAFPLKRRKKQNMKERYYLTTGLAVLAYILVLLFSIPACKDDMPAPVVPSDPVKPTEKEPRWTIVNETESVPGTDDLDGCFSIAFDGGIPYIASIDKLHPNSITVRKFNGKYWETVGEAGFTHGTVAIRNLRLRFYDHVPYLLLQRTDAYLAVAKYNGTEWGLVVPNDPYFNTGGASGLCGAVASYNNNPYIAYRVKGETLTKVWWVDGEWKRLSNIDVSPRFIELASDGQSLYFLCGEDASPHAVIVKKFNGTAWETIGKPVGENIDQASLMFDGQTPYIVYGSSTTGVLGVVRFNGNAWEKVGSDLEFDGLFPACLVFDQQIPYIMYQSKLSGEAVLRKFDGMEWKTVYTEKTDDYDIAYKKFVFGFSDDHVPVIVHLDKRGSHFVLGVSRYI